MDQIRIDKEGIYYTLYINDMQISCGHLEDLVDTVNEFTERFINGDDVDKIIEEWTTYY